MPIIRVAPTVRSTMATTLAAAFDAGLTAATLNFYTAPMPNLPTDAITTQTLLGTCIFADPAAAELNGVLTFNPLTQDDQANAGGVAVWARAIDSAGVVVADFDVGDEASTAFIKLNTTTILENGPILISSFVINVGT